MTEETPPIVRRKRRLAAGAAVLASGALLAGPITAFAQQADDDDTETPEARPERPRGGKHWRGGPGGFGRIAFDTAAEVIGIEEDELRDALRDGTTLAELAEQNGVEVQAVIDALVAEATERITTYVNEGRSD
jgi:hypothetical protein